MKFSQLANDITTSPILIFAAQVNARIAAGERIHNLTVGDFNPQLYPIPDALTEGIVAAYRERRTNYPGAHGVPVLIDAIAKLAADSHKLIIEPENIQVASGSRPLIYSLFKAVLDAGDTVVYPVPSWNNETYAQMSNAREVLVGTEAGHRFMPTASALETYIKSAQLLALCSPQNPTGTMYNGEELKKIGAMVVAENQRRGENEKPLYVMFDQVYSLLVHGQADFHHPLAVVPELADYAVFIDGLSKNFAATGVRVGWATGPAALLEKMRAFIAHIGAWAPTPEQFAAGEFLQDGEAVGQYINAINQRLEVSLDGLHEGFQRLKDEGFPVDSIAPQASIYLSVKIDIAGKSTPQGTVLASVDEIQEYLLTHAKLAVLPFSWFGAESHQHWYRISVGVFDAEDTAALLSDMKSALAELSD